MKYEKELDFKRYVKLIKSSTFDETGYMNVLECKPHFHAAKEFLFVEEGVQPIVCGGEEQILEAGDIYFSDSYSLHNYGKSEAEGYVLLISNDQFAYFNELVEGKTLPAVLKDKKANEKLFALIKEWYKDDGDALTNFGYIYRFLSMIVKDYGVVQVQVKRQDDIVRTMLEYVDENYKNDIDLESMSQHIKYSKVYCSKIWNRYLKENFRDYVNRCRVYRINEILFQKKEKKSILQIAFENGFSSQSTFYRAYKKVYGRLPTQKA